MRQYEQERRREEGRKGREGGRGREGRGEGKRSFTVNGYTLIERERQRLAVCLGFF